MRTDLTMRMEKRLRSKETEKVLEVDQRRGTATILLRVDKLQITIRQWIDKKSSLIIPTSNLMLMNISEPFHNNNSVQNQVIHAKRSSQFPKVLGAIIKLLTKSLQDNMLPNSKEFLT